MLLLDISGSLCIAATDLAVKATLKRLRSVYKMVDHLARMLQTLDKGE